MSKKRGVPLVTVIVGHPVLTDHVVFWTTILLNNFISNSNHFTNEITELLVNWSNNHLTSLIHRKNHTSNIHLNNIIIERWNYSFLCHLTSVIEQHSTQRSIDRIDSFINACLSSTHRTIWPQTWVPTIWPQALVPCAASSAQNFGVRLYWILPIGVIQENLRPKFAHCMRAALRGNRVVSSDSLVKLG